ncbi:hypothetical protein GVN24_05845 [Rhizobium sp. CRIBSB]|nr:hypothetical protein [Rhizobium sp. CRIBSB]
MMGFLMSGIMTFFHHGFRYLARTLLFLLFCMANSSFAAEKNFQFKCEGLEEKGERSDFRVKMYQGYDGWFFRKSDLESVYEQPDYVLDALSNINKALNFKGIHLILVPMIPRGLVGKDFVPNDGVLSDMIFDANLSARQFDELIETLRGNGIDVVNVNDVIDQAKGFPRENFAFKRDVHWRPEGAELVANAVAERILTVSGEGIGNVLYETTSKGVDRISKSGFHLALNEICDSAVQSESLEYYETKQVLSGLDDLDAIIDDDGDADEYVHVVGSSFTDELNPFHFNDFLRARLQRNLSGFSVSGGGVHQSIYSWARNVNGIGKRPKFVVWELPNVYQLQKYGMFMNSTIVPSIVGDCEGDYVLLSRKLSGGSEYRLEFSGGLEGENSNYIRASISEGENHPLNLVYEFGDGSEEIFNIETPPRVSGFGLFYHSFPSDRGKPVAVRMSLSNDKIFDGDVKICRYPGMGFKFAAASN